MLDIRLTLDTRKSSIKSDGTAPVVIRVPNGKHPVDIQTGISVAPADWDNQTHLCTGKGAKRLNAALQMLLGGVQQRAIELRSSGRWHQLTTAKEIRQALSGAAVQQPTATDVITYMRGLADAKSRIKTKQTYLNTIDKLTAYTGEAPLLFDDVTAKWLRGWEQWMRDQGLAVNTIGIHLRNLRTCVNRAIDDELTEVYGFRRYSIKVEATRHRALTVEELRAYLATPVTPLEEEYRDIFLLGVLLLGINLADLSRVTKIEQGRINYRRRKTGKLYSIKVEPEAQAIIDKYRGTDHLLRQFDVYSNHADYTRRINDHLKQIGGTEVGKYGKHIYHPLHPDLSWYWCRHTWASIASSIGVPEDTIRHALGHGSRSVTDTYIDYDIRHVDEANRRVIDWVLYGKK